MAVTPMALAGFGNLRALSRRNDDPTRASRPFDRDRDGFVMGEGGAMFVLEREADAPQRGARVYAEVAGCGASSDAYHMVIPSPDPAPAIAAMRQALADAGVDPGDVDYVNAHATSTPVGDACRGAACSQAVFGEHVRTDAGQLDQEHDGPPADAPPPRSRRWRAWSRCDRQARAADDQPRRPRPRVRPAATSPNEAAAARGRVAVSNSFGFGGSNTCLVLRAA